MVLSRCEGAQLGQQRDAAIFLNLRAGTGWTYLQFQHLPTCCVRFIQRVLLLSASKGRPRQFPNQCRAVHGIHAPVTR
jgi:hypothetical protein